MLKKSISLLLAAIITFGILAVIPAPVSAAAATTDKDQSVGLSTDNVQVSGSNSLGSMLAEEYEKNAENLENTGSGIYAVAVEGKTARVDVRALVDAQLIVSVFDEEGNTMYGSGMTDVSTEDTIVDLTLEIDTMPQYFCIKAFLLDKNTNQPLCKQFESDDYTQKMQEFLAKNTDDFDADKVLNLDANQNNNFLVYNDDTIIIDNDDQNTNVVAKADDKSKEYVINNIDDSIAALRPGDIFSYDFGDGLLIIKIDSIAINGTTATIHGDEMELKEAFDFIKIDTLSYANEARYDGSNLSDGVEYLETPKNSGDPVGAGIDHSDSVGLTVADWDIEHSHELKFKFGEEKAVEEYYNSETTEHNELKKQMYGEFGVKLAVNFKFFYDEYIFGRDVEMSLTVKYEFSASLKAKISLSKSSSLGLGGLFFEPVPGVTISIIPSVVVSGKLKASFALKYSGQIGFKYKNGQSEDLGKSPSLDFDIDFEGELFIGLSLEPQISVLGDVAKAKAEGIAGLRIKGKTHHSTSIPPNNSEPSEKHLCTVCIEGDISLVLELNVELSLFNNADLTWKWNLVKAEWKLTDFYWSIDHAEFGFSTCPYREYKCTVTLLNPKKEPIEGATVNDKTTDSSGKTVLYLQKGQKKLEIKKGDKTVTRSLFVHGTEKPTYVIDFDKPENALSSGSSGGSGKVVQSNRKVIDSGQCGENVFYTLYDNGYLDITGSGEMYDYEYGTIYSLWWYTNPWYNNSNNNKCDVKTINIEDGITNIGDYAFAHCTYLQTVNIPNSVTMIKKGAFEYCYSLTNLSIPNSVASIGDYAFDSCGFSNISIPDSVTSIGIGAFSHCSSLKTIDIPNSITIINEGTFLSCSSVTTIIIPTSVKSIEDGAFSGCSSLLSLSIPYSVTDIAPTAFSACDSLSNVFISEDNPKYDSRDNCNAIIETKTNTLIAGCKKTNIPNSVTSIGLFAFLSCTNLRNIIIPDSVTEIGDCAFSDCTNLTSIKISDSVTSIGNNAFEYCGNLKSLTIPDSVTFIGQGAFSDCENLTDVTLSTSIKRIESNLFNGCTNLISIIIPNSVTTIEDNAFFRCINLKHISISNSVTYIGGGAFCDCKGLLSITIPNSVMSIGNGAFDNCCSLTSITIPNSVTSIGNYAFEDCRELTSVSIGNGVTSIGASAFNNCWGLTDVNIYDLDAWCKISFGSYDANPLFYTHKLYLNNELVTDLLISDSVTSIGDYSFLSCYSLTSITIPNSVTSIGGYAFSDCDSLKDVYYGGSKEDWDKINIGYNNSDLINATIHYNSTAPATVGCAPSVEVSATESVSTIKNAAQPKAKQKPEPISVGADSETDSTEPSDFSRAHLVPETEAVLLIVKGTEETAVLNAASLLYIAQQTVDENGNVSFDVQQDFDESWVAFIFGECDHSASSWTVSKEATADEEGLKALVCDHCGEILDSEIIEAQTDAVLYGDTDNDGRITISDVTYIQRYLAELVVFNNLQLTIADVNGDGKVDINDATHLQKYLAEFDGIVLGKQN